MVLHPLEEPASLFLDLGGQLKTGQSWTPENRPPQIGGRDGWRCTSDRSYTQVGVWPSCDGVPSERMMTGGRLWKTRERFPTRGGRRSLPSAARAASTGRIHLTTSSSCKSVWILVRQLRGPHFSTWA
jgi:hypothetical protein